MTAAQTGPTEDDEEREPCLCCGCVTDRCQCDCCCAWTGIAPTGPDPRTDAAVER